MKATGIVRRIDDLGRVVIPKEIRRVFRIREGDALEIFTSREGEVIFKKYSPVGEMSSFATQYAETLNKICQMSVIITDRDSVIACAGVSKKEYLEKKLTEEFDSIMDTRSLFSASDNGKMISITEGAAGYVKYAMPIVTEGDVVGCIASIVTDGESTVVDSTEAKLIQTAASFLGKQFEG
ncbi:MAG: AbrB/MazE/SpoVT family DNA-binding domain-containing protein [Clostridia bacterium]|nr:AbrB/MazE/SpoVT family DNA-binding domain-containing protein [Clostridia bacterium]